MDPQNPQSEGGHGQPFEYPTGSNKGYYTFIVLLIAIVVVVGIALMALSKFSKSLNTTLKTAVSVKQSNYENPFITTQARAYENPFTVTPTPGSDYQNPFQ